MLPLNNECGCELMKDRRFWLKQAGIWVGTGVVTGVAAACGRRVVRGLETVVLTPDTIEDGFTPGNTEKRIKATAQLPHAGDATRAVVTFAVSDSDFDFSPDMLANSLDNAMEYFDANLPRGQDYAVEVFAAQDVKLIAHASDGDAVDLLRTLVNAYALVRQPLLKIKGTMKLNHLGRPIMADSVSIGETSFTLANSALLGPDHLDVSYRPPAPRQLPKAVIY